MTTDPYTIIIIPTISRAPSAEQMEWMGQQLKRLGASLERMGLDGQMRVYIYPMSKLWNGRMPQWATTWRKPAKFSLDPLPVVWFNVWGAARTNPSDVILECESVRVGADEVWCLNDYGHGQISNSPPAKIWRRAKEELHANKALKYKLIPSWVVNEVPDPPAKKEKRSGKAGRVVSPAPKARGSGRGCAERAVGDFKDLFPGLSERSELPRCGEDPMV